MAAGDQEDAHHDDREQGEQRADQPGADVGEGRGDIVERAGGVVGDVLELADEVVVLVETPQRVVVLDGVVEVLDVAGGVVDEIAAGGDGRRDQDHPDPDRDQDQGQVDDRDRSAARHVPLEQADRGRDRDGDEGRDAEPADRRPQQVDQIERDRAGDDGRDDANDAAQRRLVLLDDDCIRFRDLGVRRIALRAGGCGMIRHPHGS